MRKLIAPVLFAAMLLGAAQYRAAQAQDGRPVMIVNVNGSINPATDDYLRTSLTKAKDQNAQLVVLKINTPGGLLTSMQTMVESILTSPVPVAVYVAPSGGGAISAGAFIVMAGHFAVMSPGTNIGAAHPVLSDGGDVKGDMGAKVENFAVSLIKAIAEQRGRNTKWAEQAVRESVAITDRDAVQERVVDFVAADLDSLLNQAEGRTVTVNGRPVTLRGLAAAPRIEVPMNFKQEVVNVLANPNIAILLGLGALLGLGIELYHPGAVLPGVVGAICLILSLTAGQVLPISHGGVALMCLSALFFVVELFLPAFGIWGAAGIICLVLGSIYFIDTDQVWSAEGFTVDKTMIGSIAAVVGALLMSVCYLAMKSGRQKVLSGPERLIDQEARVLGDFKTISNDTGEGKVGVGGEIWKARIDLPQGAALPVEGERVVVTAVNGLVVKVRTI